MTENILERSVSGNILTSHSLPAIQLRVDPAFRYIGRFSFTVNDIAEGERYIFVDAEKMTVKRLFIFQFEEILPSNNITYNYNFKDAIDLNGHPFIHGIYAHSYQNDKRINPGDEGALTADFLEKNGYVIEDEYMMSRFVTVPDEERKHELIMFYIENIRPTGHNLSEFYEVGKEEETPIWQEISKELIEQSLAAFSVLK